MRCACDTPVKIVGGNQKPFTGSSHGGDQRCAPSASPTSDSSRILASWAAELMAPTSVFLSSGSPSRRVASRRRSDASTSEYTDSCTSSREPAQQTWPWLKKMPFTMPSTAWSTGASSNTTLAALPPSSRVTFLRVGGAGAGDLLADLGGAGERHLVDAGVLHQRPAGLPRPGDDVDHARRQVGLLADLGERQRGQRRRLGGLEHHRVAAGQRRGDLPGQHQQREVPRDDLAGHPERARRRAVAGVLQLVGPAGVVEEVRRDQRDVHVARLADRLAVVERLEHGELARPFLDDPGDAEQVLGPLPARHDRPGVLVGLAGGGDRPVHVGGTGLGHLGQDLLGGRRDGLERVAVHAGAELAVDEEPVGLAQRDDRPRLRRRRVLELRHVSPG